MIEKIFDESLRRAREVKTKVIASVCEITVATATPATSILKPMTNTKFKMTFVIPAAIKNISGFFVSPFAYKIAAPKL